jgi:hypothetical protein
MRGVALLAAAMAAFLLVPATAPAATVPARSAADFRDSIGVQTHLSYYDTAYGDAPRVVRKLDELGVDHVRDGMYANPGWGDWNERYYQAVELAASHGKRFLFGMGEPGWRAGTPDELVAAVAGRLRSAVAGLEGPNEYDLFHGGPDWAPELRDYQAELYSRVRAEPRLAGVPVVGPSLVYDDRDGQLGSLARSVDFGNIHPYTGGLAPSADLLRGRFDAVSHVFGDRPLFATEAGFHNALSATDGQAPVTEAVAASYLLRTYLEHFRAGIRRTYAYELLDEQPEDANTQPEQHFGLLRNDFSEKPAFAALRALLELVGRPAPVDPTPLDLDLGGETGGVQRLLLQQADGRYSLVLWQSASEYDRDQQRGLTVAPRRVELNLPAAAEVQVARPTQDGAALRSLGRRTSAPIDVYADPVVVQLDFGGPVEAGQPAPGGDSGTAAPVATPAPPDAACTLSGSGVLLSKMDASARIAKGDSRTRPVRVAFCSQRPGKVVTELGSAGHSGNVKHVLASASVSVAAGAAVSLTPQWSKSASARLGGARPAVRVRFRPAGARHDIVFGLPLDVTALRRRR